VSSIGSILTANASTAGEKAAVQEDLIFDVGFNIGQDTGFYLSQGYRVLAVEADPTLAQAARAKFGKEIEAGRLEVLNVGIADKDGFAEFWICEEKPEFNSFYREIAARDDYSHHRIEIPVMRFETVLERYGTPKYLKIDIEGNDMLCLNALSSTHLPTYVSIESECPLDEGADGLEEGLALLRKLHSLGYRKFKLIDQHTFCAVTSPPSLHHRVDTAFRAVRDTTPLKRVRGLDLIYRHLLTARKLERKFDWTFVIGCSGVWGEDTPGKWITFDEAVEAYKYFRDLHFKTSDRTFHSFWCDWHAKL
jgi:FkbM family methyltransferase